MVVARASGSATCFTLPHVRAVATFELGVRPLRLELNCDSTRLLCVDTNGALAQVKLPMGGAAGHAPQVDVERKVGRGSLIYHGGPAVKVGGLVCS